MSDFIEIWREFQPHKFLGMTDAEGAMAQEILRLRVRVAVLETALRHYSEDEYNGHNATGACARAALEAKP